MPVIEKPGAAGTRQGARLENAGGALGADAAGSRLVFPDVRLANLSRIVREMRRAGPLTRADVARRAGVSLPTRAPPGF